MEFKTFAEDIRLPVVGLGTWKMGGVLSSDYSGDKNYIEAIEYAVEKGIINIDTAEIYGAGHAEELVGQAIRNTSRKKLFITTKVFPNHLAYEEVLAACTRSLARLKTDYIDLYLIHWPNPLASIKNTMRAFDKLVEEGMIRYVGVSNFSLNQFKNAQKYTKNKIVCNQIEFSLLERGPEAELLNYLSAEDLILTAYSPLGQGKLRPGEFDTLDKVAEKYGKTAVQVALRWLIEKPQTVVIPKASSKEHIDEILGSLGWKLKEEDTCYLNSEFRA